LYQNALRRFDRNNKIHLYCGDSGKMLNRIIEEIPSTHRVLFWLDGHYSAGITAKGDKDTPILSELDHVFSLLSEGVILIDDARCFTGIGDYPTIEDLKEYIQKRVHSDFSIKNDIIIVIFGV